MENSQNISSYKFDLFWTISFSHIYIELGSVKANGRKPKTGLGRVFNFKLGCFDGVHVLIYADACPHL
jgi:hypothetical protein